MTLYFEEEGGIKLPLECETLAKKVIEEALDYVNCPYEAQVNLLLTENEQIHEMNREFRGIDRATDVLSFPMIDYPEPGTFDFLEEEYGRDNVAAALRGMRNTIDIGVTYYPKINEFKGKRSLQIVIKNYCRVSLN